MEYNSWFRRLLEGIAHGNAMIENEVYSQASVHAFQNFSKHAKGPRKDINCSCTHSYVWLSCTFYLINDL